MSQAELNKAAEGLYYRLWAMAAHTDPYPWEKLPEQAREYWRDQVHRPSRGSDIEEWLKAKRDAEVYWNPASGERRTHRWPILDDLLDEYRLRADTGLLLSQDIE